MRRFCASTATSRLKSRVKELVPERRAALLDVKKIHGNKVFDTVKVEQVIGGMRDVKCMFWDNSLLDAEAGIRFQGKSLDELKVELSPNGDEPKTEAMLWYLFTSEVPTDMEIVDLRNELHARSHISDDLLERITSLPKTMHPMTKLTSALMLLETESVFAEQYREGTISKDQYWDATYEDVLNLISKLPKVCSTIYHTTYPNTSSPLYCGEDADYASKFCKLMGFEDAGFEELMRLYLYIHTDHEGGNASAHTCRLVGSTLANPYLAVGASMNALAGPLHGLANQEVLHWIMKMRDEMATDGHAITHDTVRAYAEKTLSEGKVIPGYGHAVLRVTDPRYTLQRGFAQKHMPEDELFQLVSTIYEVVPDVLKKQGKVKNPYPNVDSHSGVLLYHYGFTQYDYYTVLFGLGRALGVGSQLVWDRALNLPLERPKSVTLDCLTK